MTNYKKKLLSLQTGYSYEAKKSLYKRMSVRSCIIIAFYALLFCASTAFGEWMDTCAHLRTWRAVNPSDEVRAQMQYDTLRLYIDKCAVSDTRSWDAFSPLSGADQYRSDDPIRFLEFRSWLLSVLYLNTIQPEYYCACVGAISSTYEKTVDVLAIMNFIRQNHRECWGGSNDSQYAQDSAAAVQGGHDPNNLPSLDSLGLGALLKAGAPSSMPSISTHYLASITCSPNPFRKETTLDFTLNRMSNISLEIFDELGRPVWGDVEDPPGRRKGSSLEAGTHSIHLDGNSLPSGTLYA
ncbi:MAG: hypothetical protein ABI778_11765, partial [Ignavibacteriota bacterium]